MTSFASTIPTLTDKHFIDWFNHWFPYCYGSGEKHIVQALRMFFICLKVGNGRSYSSEVVESVLGPAVAWLMIGKLCGADIFEYGTSPRYAWLTKKGEMLDAYLAGKTSEYLIELVTKADHVYCYPDVCNCAHPCENPLFENDRL